MTKKFGLLTILLIHTLVIFLIAYNAGWELGRDVGRAEIVLKHGGCKITHLAPPWIKEYD